MSREYEDALVPVGATVTVHEHLLTVRQLISDDHVLEVVVAHGDAAVVVAHVPARRPGNVLGAWKSDIDAIPPEAVRAGWSQLQLLVYEQTTAERASAKLSFMRRAYALSCDGTDIVELSTRVSQMGKRELEAALEPIAAARDAATKQAESIRRRAVIPMWSIIE